MEHVVFFPAADGTPAFRRVAGLEEAVRLVEHLRNEQDVAQASVHVLTEVPLSFKAYYRVEVPSLEALQAPPAPVVEAAPAPVAAPAAGPVEELVPAQAEPDVEADLVLTAPAAPTSASLGFFA